jgi:aryl-alcohol dehydrogenase-like predicted oxidoreductase
MLVSNDHSNTTTGRLVLGTAQLGMQYGINNKSGQPDLQTAEDIVKAAWEGGIREFDTAHAYGESECVLGKVLRRLEIENEVKVITKLSSTINHLVPMDLKQTLEESLERLCVSKLYGIMLHREELLDQWDQGLGETLSELVSSGLVDHIGVSVYSPQKSLEALEIKDIKMVQVPSNIIDRRFEDAGVFQSAERKSKIIYVRSIFLQGLLFKDHDDLLPSMSFASQILRKFELLANKAEISKQQLALGYVREVYPEAKMLFGAETISQVKSNLEVWNHTLSPWIVKEAQELFHDVDERVLNPSLWN